jgi:glycosyltransferase A (GT-A) superfamily protein (DUF2064 family)
MRSERGALAIFARWPEPGRILPALTTGIGADAAAQVYEAFVGDLVAGLCRPSLGFDAFLYAADRPDAFRGRFPTAPVRPQQGRGEGRRYHACFEELLATHARAAIIGSSLPNLHPRMLLGAFEMLERHDVVVGPTDRGGIYLLAMREPRDVFAGVRWERGAVLGALLDRFRRAHLDYGFFPTRRKVDACEDLADLRARLLRPMAPLTYATLRALGVAEAPREAREFRPSATRSSGGGPPGRGA